MNLGVETETFGVELTSFELFQHSLMNLGVETTASGFSSNQLVRVSAFSDESWGGDPFNASRPGKSGGRFQHSLMNLGVETCLLTPETPRRMTVSAFSDESWGGDLVGPKSTSSTSPNR